MKIFKYGGAFAGKTLIFKMADKEMGTTTMWESGMATVLDLAIDQGPVLKDRYRLLG